MNDKIRVLLVEDNPADAKAIYEYLRINYRNEFDFTHSLTMASAINSLSENTFDTILLDLSLPDVSGLDTLNEIKGFAKDIPIIVFTGLNDEKISIEAIKAGAQDYVIKGIYAGPFIYRVIRYAIERKALEKEVEENRLLLEKKSMQLQVLNKSLEELNNNKDKFYSIVAHDLINPFNALSTTSQLLAETFNSGTNKEETNELIQLINESVKKISNLLKDLFEWTALNTGRLDFEPVSVDLNELVTESVVFHRFIARNKNITINYSVPEKINIRADRFMIKTVFRNLITNAIKFTNPGGSIDINADLNENFVDIEIEDTGIGMTEDEVNSLFKVDKNKSKKGTYQEIGSGLGLILCKDFIVKNRGSLNIKSEAGKGSIFKITLPQFEE